MTTSVRTRHASQTFAASVGAIFLLVGILGFLPGITAHFEDMTLVGYQSRTMLLGLFHVSILHNVVHLGFGVAGLALSRTRRTAKAYLFVGGLVYLVLALVGALAGRTSTAEAVPMNDADNILHLGLGIILPALAVLSEKLGQIRVKE